MLIRATQESDPAAAANVRPKPVPLVILEAPDVLPAIDTGECTLACNKMQQCGVDQTVAAATLQVGRHLPTMAAAVSLFFCVRANSCRHERESRRTNGMHAEGEDGSVPLAVPHAAALRPSRRPPFALIDVPTFEGERASPRGAVASRALARDAALSLRFFRRGWRDDEQQQHKAQDGHDVAIGLGSGVVICE